MTDSDGNTTPTGIGLELLDTFFTIIFTVELAINAFAHWFRPFVSDGWNAFDCIVVSLSLVALGPMSMPINVLRSLRAFRVVRLFGRMGTLRDIVSSLTAAILPVLNAFLIMLIVGSICEALRMDSLPWRAQFFALLSIKFSVGSPDPMCQAPHFSEITSSSVR